jgi:hypothetical protein
MYLAVQSELSVLTHLTYMRSLAKLTAIRGGTRLESWPGHRISWAHSLFSSVLPRKYQDSISNRPQSLPSKSSHFIKPTILLPTNRDVTAYPTEERNSLRPVLAYLVVSGEQYTRLLFWPPSIVMTSFSNWICFRSDGGFVQSTRPRAPTSAVSANGGPWEHSSKWHLHGWRTERRLRVKSNQMGSQEATPGQTPGVSSSQAQSTARESELKTFLRQEKRISSV